MRLPAAFRFKGCDVQIERRGDVVILREKGESMGAVANGAVLVTSNTRDFSHILGLRIENWA